MMCGVSPGSQIWCLCPTIKRMPTISTWHLYLPTFQRKIGHGPLQVGSGAILLPSVSGIIFRGFYGLRRMIRLFPNTSVKQRRNGVLLKMSILTMTIFHGRSTCEKGDASKDCIFLQQLMHYL